MRLFGIQSMGVALAVIIVNGVAPAQAGVIPWAYNAVFGTTPMYGGYAYGAPAYGYSVGYPSPIVQSSYYSPAWSTYTAGYAPTFSYSSYGTGIASYGYVNPCAACGCGPCSCDPCGCSSGNCPGGQCTGGNCASGNCGAGYAPNIENGPTPEPTRATPNPPPANPPVNRNEPPIDDFTRVPPRTNDNPMPGSTIPRSSVPANSLPPAGSAPNPSSTIPNPGTSTIPGNTAPSSTIPNNIPPASTIPNTTPNTTIPGSTVPGSTIPNPNAVPDMNNTPSAIPFGGSSGINDQFEPPVNRNPASESPLNSTDQGGFGPGAIRTAPAPLEIESAPVASLQVQRERIVSQAGFRHVPVARMAISPQLTPAEFARK